MNQEIDLDKLGVDFLEAVAVHAGGDIDRAEEMLRKVIRTEPRLAEPHLELAHLLLATERLDDAEGHAREGLEHLSSTGLWMEDLVEEDVRALAHRMLGEILRRRAESDDMVFGDAAVFRATLEESRLHFSTASKLDPTDTESGQAAFFLGFGADGMPTDEVVAGEDGEDETEKEPD